MPGTGIHGYTGTSANGLYNISNGIIQSSAPSTNANNISYGGSSGNNIASAVGSAVANAMTANHSNIASQVAAQVAGRAGSDATDYGEMIRQILAQSQANTAQSQAFAREQMDYQTRSDATAMNWSAQEAEKNRAWQESLADTAHQREVRDLVAAGLNPILSANNGAYTGSGATGQGFSSSGAMGNVDSTGVAAAGSLLATKMNTASQAMIAKLYTDTEKYQADLNYSASRLNTEASILNNRYTNNTSKNIALQQMQNDLIKTKLQGEYGIQGHYIDQDTQITTHGMDNQTKQELQEDQQQHEVGMQSSEFMHESNKQRKEMTQRDKELLAAYERTALELLNGPIWTTGGITGLGVNAETAARELRGFLEDPEKTYKKWQQIQKEGGARGSVLGYLFGFS